MKLESSVSIAYSSTLAVTTSEAKLHLRITSTDEDSILSIYLAAAQRRVEEYCNICLIGGSVTQIFTDGWQDYFDLSIGNCSGITSVSFNEITATTFTTVDTDYYLLDKAYNRPRVFNIGDSGWPDGTPFQIKIIYASGFSDAASVPADIKAAILLTLGDLYENRQDAKSELTSVVQSILQPYRCIQMI